MRRLFFALWARVTALVGRRRFETELDEELQYHLDEATARHIRQGLSWAAARAAAERQLGNIGLTKEAVRDEAGGRPLQDFGRDIRLAVSQLIRRPAFSTAVIATIGICIAANTAVFSVVYSVVLAPLPFQDAERIVRLYNSYPTSGVTRTSSSVPEYFDRREQASTLQHVALYREESNTIGTTGSSRHTFALRVTPTFFDLLGTRAVLGRVLSEGDDAPGAPPAVVLGHGLWQTLFAGRPDVADATIVLDGTTFRIVGVLPEHFRFPSWDAQVFTALTFRPEDRDVRSRHVDSFQMLARLAPGATVAEAQAEVTALNLAALSTYPADLHQRISASGYHTTVQPYLADMTRDVRDPLYLLWTGGLLILAIGITNVAVLVLLRTRSRSNELAVRAALGASRSRLARQLITETSLLTLAGGALGLAGAGFALRLLSAFEVYEIPRVGDVAISGAVIAWTTGSIVLTALLAGVLPAVTAVGRPAGLLAGTPRTTTPAPPWPLRLLVSGQIAFAMVLALTAGLLLASLRNLQAIDPGFVSEPVSVAALILPAQRYPTPEARIEMVGRVLDAIEGAPGVVRAATATQLPFSGNTTRMPFVPEGRAHADGGVPTPFGTTVSAGYFDTLGIRLIAGRGFLPSDTRQSRRVAIIDEVLAERYWPDGAVGQRFWAAPRAGDQSDAVTIIGIVTAVRQASLREVDTPGAVYSPVTQSSPGFFRLAVKYQGPDRPWIPVVERIASVDASLAPFWTDTLAASVSDSLLVQRAPTQLLGVFWAVGLLLGVLGVYGVLAHELAARRREIAVRVAIGGGHRDIVGLIWRRWWLLVGPGVAAGIPGAILASRLVGSLVFNTSLVDPSVIAAAAGTLIGASALAAVGPVRRALHVDPALTLRQD